MNFEIERDTAGADQDGVLLRMQHLLTTWEQQGDRRCVFLRCYWHMTAAALEAIRARRFQDSTWLSVLLQRFAGYYFSALDAYVHGHEQIAPVWQQTFDLARSRATLIVEDLVLGINAHINRDLAFVVYDLLREEWEKLAANERAARKADYDLVNTLIAETTQAVQHDVVERYSSLARTACEACRPVVRIFDLEADRLIEAWRDDAWNNGLQMIEARTAEERSQRAQRIEDAAFHRMHLVLSDVEFRDQLLVTPSDHLIHLTIPHMINLCDLHRDAIRGRAE